MTYDLTAEQYPSEPLGLVWIACSHPVVSAGLATILKEEARVHVGWESPQGDAPSSVILGIDEDLSEGVERARKANPQILVMVLGLDPNPSLARTAFNAGAHGYIHTGMTHEQIISALKVVSADVLVAPKGLLGYLIMNEEPVDFDKLSARQYEILELAGEGLTNAQIAKRFFLTESTVKQHLRSADKVLGVNNRTEAAKLMRRGD